MWPRGRRSVQIGVFDNAANADRMALTLTPLRHVTVTELPVAARADVVGDGHHDAGPSRATINAAGDVGAADAYASSTDHGLACSGQRSGLLCLS